MKILVVGSGGREHALCWAIASSPLCSTLYCAPGNAGIAREAICVPLEAQDIEGLVAFAKKTQIDFVVVGPEAPLVLGLVDDLEAAGIAAFGPSAGAAKLEASKGYARDLCQRYGIPGPKYGRFVTEKEAVSYVRGCGAPIVVKADGLAAGKGVIVAATLDEAETAIREIMNGQFGSAGTSVVVEDCLVGEEASYFALVNGTSVLPLAGAQDHKTVGEGDVGLNTGGMGAYSPTPAVDEKVGAYILHNIIKPVAAAMVEEGHPYKGLLYAGVMLTSDGPKILEFNVRFGDPECQVILPRLMSDLVSALMATRDGELDHFDVRWLPKVALNVVMAARGYPGPYERNTEIRGLEKLDSLDDIHVFHSGTSENSGKIIATGGRVLGITALGDNVAEAQEKAYGAIGLIDWPSGFCRGDIGWRALSSG
jgi:phosphoribosylamine--glycine ligase